MPRGKPGEEPGKVIVALYEHIEATGVELSACGEGFPELLASIEGAADRSARWDRRVSTSRSRRRPGEAGVDKHAAKNRPHW